MAVQINRERCVKCAGCVGVCPQNILDFVGGRIVVDKTCTDCGICVKFCPVSALSLSEKK